jgi:hypothetical protein
MMKALATFLLTGFALFAVPAFAQDAGKTSEDTNMEILMEKLKADKKLLVANNMDLTDAESKAFWPLYDAYQKDLQQINDRLKKTIGEYAEAYNQGNGKIPNDKAKKLLDEALATQEAEVKLKRTYAEKIGKILPGTKTVRYIQIENKVRALVNFELARVIPLVY